MLLFLIHNNYSGYVLSWTLSSEVDTLKESIYVAPDVEF